MGRKGKVLKEIKRKVVEDYLEEKRSVRQIADQLQISCYSVEEWIRKYKAFDLSGLIAKHANTHYTSELKVQSITNYINTKGSSYDICISYNISSHALLPGWIKKYNGHNTFKTHSTKEANTMTSGRKTTYEERIQIIPFCIANANNYKLTANEYKASYQQI
ncbi:hypothetical protein [Clostridium botulinum]|uniref:hypothetical protein n=1 Tax=Clostridium botulinum TaxID=1491 RepID=UPI000A173FD5|nr:hypothetical protein [Clostridium botulinum]